MKSSVSILSMALVLFLTALLSGCSTTRRIEIDDPLYTGVKKMEVLPLEGEKFPGEVKSLLKEAVNVAPNNCLISPSVRYPFPLGLWVYNNWSNPPSGFKHWLYEKLVAEPVLISTVRPEVRVKMLDEILENNGYFSGSSSYELIKGKNPKKARITYSVNAGPAYLLDSIALLPDNCLLYHILDSVAAKSSYLTSGARYSVDSLSTLRTKMANSARNRGYYYFRPDYIEYLADSTIAPQRISLRMAISKTAPDFAMERYKTGNITVNVYRNQGGGDPDTINTPNGRIIRMVPSKLRLQAVEGCLTFRQGGTFSVLDMDRTQSYLSQLGIFNAIDMEVTPDTVSGKKLLDVDISCTLDSPLEASIEVNATSKSNSYLGPGLTLGVTNRNLFGGGEQFNIGVTGTYEWQTGHDSNSLFNSYELRLSASLSFPRLIAPRFFKRRKWASNWTRVSLNGDLLNRPHYFKMAQVNASFGYDWQLSRHASNTLTLFKLTYTKLISTTQEFDSIMAANPAIEQSFKSQFIPQMTYTYTYDRNFGSNTLNWQFTLQEAGNIFWSLWRICGDKGEKKLFDTPFSQFLKGSAQLVYGRKLFGDHWLVARAGVGIAHAYGNSSQVPYSEQFYVGGANSVRAFTVRSIGPGRYHSPNSSYNDYFDQTGTFKVELNAEYRFPIFGMLHGALFLDAGNVWLLEDDPYRPGSKLQAKYFFKDLALGTGAGLRFDLGMLVIRGDLGIGLHLPYDTGKKGYYNMTSFKDSLAFHLAIGYPF